MPLWREGIYDIDGLRELLLKARKLGFSTLFLAIFFCKTVNEQNTQTVVIADEKGNTARLFQIVKRFYEHLPIEKKPVSKYANRYEYYWPDLDSYFFVGTAGSGNFGRGGTVNYVLGSEVGSWTNGEDIVAGLLESVPTSGAVFLESTANGLGNFFHTEYEAAKNGDSIYKPRFYAWFQNPQYRQETESLVRTEIEQKRADQYGLDDEQIAWYRTKAKTLREKLPQEHPTTDIEAFLSSGNPYFDREKLVNLKASVGESIDFEIPDQYETLKIAKAHLTLWKLPEPGRTYIVAADTAEGLTEEGDPDFDSADVVDAETWEQVGHLHGRWDTHEYGVMLAELGFWFNTALLGVERNNHGHAVINGARHTGKYPDQIPGECKGLYLHEEYDEKKKAKARKPGWPTTPKTKYFALDGLASSIVEDDIKINSEQTIGELFTFVRKPGGKAGGEGRSHDDRVMSLAVADALLRSGIYKKPLPKEPVTFFKIRV